MILLRETVESDIEEIYNYIHLDYVKKYCTDCEEQWKAHERWYKFLIHSDAYLLYTITSTETGNFLGCVKFEIDDYITPCMKVVAIEGEKESVDKVYEELKNLLT